MPDPYLSEIKYLGGGSLDFIEIAVDAGDDPSGIQVLVYNKNGTLRSDSDLLTVVNTQFGKDIYVLDKATSPSFTGISKNGSIALVKDGVVLQYVAFTGSTAVAATEGAAAGTPLTYIGNVSSKSESLEATGPDGSSYAVQTNPTSGSVPCFVAGTRIKTPAGVRPVEDIAVGDLVMTTDNGPQRVIWRGEKTVSVVDNPDFAPVLLPRDCLGHNRPNRDLLVSRNHRVQIPAGQAEIMFAEQEVLISAKHLIGHNGIRAAESGPDVAYVHLLFARHEILTSNGLESESLNPAGCGIHAFGPETRDEILMFFPDLAHGPGGYGQTARLCLRRFESELALTLLVA